MSAMPNFPDAIPPCPQCQGTLRFVSSVRSGDPRAVATGNLDLDMILIGLSEKGVSLEIFTFECGRCGPIHLSGPVPGQDTDNRDRDSLVGAPRKPSPIVNQSAIAVPEPDEHS
jgi:hypothetical protein